MLLFLVCSLETQSPLSEQLRSSHSHHPKIKDSYIYIASLFKGGEFHVTEWNKDGFGTLRTCSHVLNRKEGNRGHVFILYFISSRSLKLSSSRTLAGDKLFNIVRNQKRSVLTVDRGIF